MVAIQLVGVFFMPLEVLAERGSRKQNTERWDMLLTTLIIPVFLMKQGGCGRLTG